jgi:hypothetical protein
VGKVGGTEWEGNCRVQEAGFRVQVLPREIDLELEAVPEP